eukprot:COSAG02_NODE_10480_length_1932_cov_2.028914_1_plen_193_part_00
MLRVLAIAAKARWNLDAGVHRCCWLCAAGSADRVATAAQAGCCHCELAPYHHATRPWQLVCASRGSRPQPDELCQEGPRRQPLYPGSRVPDHLFRRTCRAVPRRRVLPGIHHRFMVGREHDGRAGVREARAGLLYPGRGLQLSQEFPQGPPRCQLQRDGGPFRCCPMRGAAPWTAAATSSCSDAGIARLSPW